METREEYMEVQEETAQHQSSKAHLGTYWALVIEEQF